MWKVNEMLVNTGRRVGGCQSHDRRQVGRERERVCVCVCVLVERALREPNGTMGREGEVRDRRKAQGGGHADGMWGRKSAIILSSSWPEPGEGKLCTCMLGAKGCSKTK